MSCTDFPSAGLIPNVTTHTVGNITYIWTGIAWESQVNVPAGELVNDLSQAYIFDTVADYEASTIVFPVGKLIHLKDRGADFTVISGTGTGNGMDIITNNSVSQSIKYIFKGTVNINHFGAVKGDNDNYAIAQRAADYLKEVGGGVLTNTSDHNEENYNNEPLRYLVSDTVQIEVEKVVVDMTGAFGPHGAHVGYLVELTQNKDLTDATTTGKQFFDGSMWIFPKQMTVKSLILDGRSPDLQTRQSKCVKFNHLSHSNIFGVICQYGIERSVHIDSVIESDFYGLQIRMCGKSSALSSDAVLYLVNEGVNSWDANNNIRFHGLSVAYPAGSMLYIDSNTLINGGAGPAFNTVRNIYFYGAQFHHRDVDIDGSEGAGQANYPSALHSPAAAGVVQDDTSLEFRNCGGIHFIGGNIRLGMSSNGTLCKFGDLASGRPCTDITFAQARLSGEGTTATGLDLDFVQTSAGPGVQILASDIAFTGASTVVATGDVNRMVINAFGELSQVMYGAPTDTAHSIKLDGDVQPRLRFSSDGRIAIGDGTSAPDVEIRRSAAGTALCTGKFGSDTGLIVGNSSTSSPDVTGTSKVRKVEVYGAGGGALGFIQIYAG